MTCPESTWRCECECNRVGAIRAVSAQMGHCGGKIACVRGCRQERDLEQLRLCWGDEVDVEKVLVRVGGKGCTLGSNVSWVLHPFPLTCSSFILKHLTLQRTNQQTTTLHFWESLPFREYVHFYFLPFNNSGGCQGAELSLLLIYLRTEQMVPTTSSGRSRTPNF